MKNPFTYLSILSIDVVLGALASGIMATIMLQVSPGWAWWVVLSASVWLVYTTDHLIDGIKIGKTAASVRHLFHYKYRKILIICIGLIGTATGIIAFLFLERQVIWFGVVLAVLILIYLLVVSGRKWINPNLLQKEIFVALFYTAGIWGGIVALRHGRLEFNEYLVIILFFGLALIDLLVLSWYEAQSDQWDGQESFVTKYGEEKARNAIVLLAVLIATGIIYLLMTASSRPVLTAAKMFMPMLVILLYIYYNPDKLRKKNAYRYLCEVVFFIPGLMIFM